MIGITGAGGFIGSHLVEAMLARGEDVLATDISQSLPPNLSELAGKGGFHYRICDVRKASEVSEAFPSDVQVIYHMASAVGVDQYINDPIGTIDSVFIGTRNVLERCVNHNTRLVYMSTSEIYGRNPQVPWSEESDRVLGDPSIDRWCYSTSKALCEHLINAIHRKYDLPTTIVRPFNVYGPRQRPAFVIPAVLSRILRGEPPVIYDDGNQTRCFTYVRDVVDGLLLCIDGHAAVGQTFNLGSEHESTVDEVVKIALRVCGSNLEPVHVDTKKHLGERYEDIGRRVPDSSKASRMLGWSATTPIEAGIKQTVEWMKMR
ncbi:MAG: GDP-mannose 4,6-dehydratase [Nitrososphaerota archaeon]|nr:GDP-mannose 4,6-dehydratase [Nitrososphaerota archaeon]